MKGTSLVSDIHIDWSVVKSLMYVFVAMLQMQ